MLRYALALGAASAISAPAFAQVQIEAQGPVVSLSVTESVALNPDIANLSAGVTTVEPTAVASMRANARQMTRVIDRIEALGIDREDIQTSGITLNPQYDYNQRTQQQVFRGYRVSNRVNIVVRDIDRAGEVLDQLVDVGATDIGGIGWDVEDSTPALEQARMTAFTTGRDRALAYAAMSGFSNVRLLEVSENVMSSRPVAYEDRIVVTGSSIGAPPTPTRPGMVNVSVTVNYSYEMVQ